MPEPIIQLASSRADQTGRFQRVMDLWLDHWFCRKGLIYPAYSPGVLPRYLGRQTCLLFSLLLLLCSPYVLAEGSKDTSIGFVDIPYIINNAPQALEAELRLEVEFAPREEQLKEQRLRLEELNDQLRREALELSDTELAQLDREVRSLERRIKRDEQDFREELNIQKNNEFKKVRILVLETIAKFGKANSYDLIVSDGVLYANKKIDVTEDVLDSLRRANQQLSSSN